VLKRCLIGANTNPMKPGADTQRCTNKPGSVLKSLTQIS
jgi:hypothetical protein